MPLLDVFLVRVYDYLASRTWALVILAAGLMGLIALASVASVKLLSTH